MDEGWLSEDEGGSSDHDDGTGTPGAGTAQATATPRPFPPRTSPTNGTCAHCVQFMQDLEPKLVLAERTQLELKKARAAAKNVGTIRGQEKYHMNRLRAGLLENACDPQTGALYMHRACMSRLIGVGPKFIKALHKAAEELAKGTPKQMCWEEVQSKGLQSQVSVPAVWESTRDAYLHSLKPASECTLVLSRAKHNYKRRRNNNKDEQREYCVEFVKASRQLTGRTKDADGRFHGAEHYLACQYKTMRRDGSANGKVRYADSEVFSLAVQAYMINRHGVEKAKVAHARTICRWFKEDFKVGHTNGHTTIHPHKSDSCKKCSTIDLDLARLRASIQKFTGSFAQTDTPELRAKVFDLRAQVRTAVHMCVLMVQ